MTNELNLYIIRHGETDYNKRGIVQGKGIDSDLNEIGISQAQSFYNAYHNIPFDVIYTSTLKRTHQTVAPFLRHTINHQTREELDEIDWGIYEGKAVQNDFHDEYKKVTELWKKGEIDLRIDGGDSPQDLKIRQQSFIDSTLYNSSQNNVLICMHGRALRIFLCTLLNQDLATMDEFPHQNLSLYKLQRKDNLFSIDLFNDTSHLDE